MLSKWFQFLLLFFTALEKTSSILDADYYIQNADDPRLCIEGGAARENLTASVGIFHEGTLGTNVCRNKLEQQWHFIKIGRSQGNRLLCNISSSAPEKFLSGTLSANITGFFMKYWPNPVELIEPEEQDARWSLVKIKGLEKDDCVENAGKGRLLKNSQCNFKSLKQTWSLRLVTHGFV